MATTATPNYVKNRKIQNGVFAGLTVLFLGLVLWMRKREYRSMVFVRFAVIAVLSYIIAAVVMHKVIPCKATGAAKGVGTPTAAPTDATAAATVTAPDTDTETAATAAA